MDVLSNVIKQKFFLTKKKRNAAKFQETYKVVEENYVTDSKQNDVSLHWTEDGV